MKILHISTWDNLGGSGRSAYRIHTGLKLLDVQSRMLVGNKTLKSPDIRRIGGRLAFADRIVGKIFDKADLQYLVYPASFFLHFDPWFRDADLVQIFNTHGGYFSHLAIASLSRLRPIVWRLSDMWPMTGHCSYSYDCEKWLEGCGKCPRLDEYPALHNDTSAFLWKIKDKIYRNARMYIVAPSAWMAGLVKKSPLLNRFPTVVIPNGLNTETFRPYPKAEAKIKFGLNPKNPVLLLSASSLLLPRKGAQFLKDALALLKSEKPIEVLVMGENASDFSKTLMNHFSFKITSIGPIRDDTIMAQAYSAADIFILPTLAENLPNGIIESASCGTPAVAFNTGGLSDALRHMENGYLARYKDAIDLSQGINLLLNDLALRENMSKKCRDIALQEYSYILQAKRFFDFYKQVLK